jgi:hypothetical protein
MTDKDEKPKDEAKDEPTPVKEETPEPTVPPAAAPAAQPAAHHTSHDVGEAIDKMSHTVEAQMGMFESLFTKPMIVFGVIVGILLQFVGATLLNFNFHLDVSQVISNIGILIMLIVLMGGALMNDKLDPYVRFGMLFVAAFIGGFSQIVYT